MPLEVRFENKTGWHANAFEGLLREVVWVCGVWKADEKRYFQVSYFQRASGVDASEICQVAVGSWVVLTASEQSRTSKLEWWANVKWKKNELEQFSSKKYTSRLGKILHGSANIDNRCSYNYSIRQ